MIGMISKGRGFRGTLNYLLKKEQGRLIGGNMLGQNARELAAEFKLSRQLNPKIEQPVFHVSLSVPHYERPNDEQWNKIASDYLQQMGFTNNQYVVVQHSDREHNHIHIVASKGTLDGKCVPVWNDYYNSQKIIRQLEQNYNLQAVQSTWEIERKGPTKGQHEQHRREQAAGAALTPNVKGRIQDIADSVIQDCTTREQFIEKMRSAGVQVQTHTRRDNSISGISYKYTVDGTTVATPGTKLGTDYSWNGIQRRIQEQEQQQTQSGLEKYTDEELLLVPSSVANYFAARPPKPPQEEDKEQWQQQEKTYQDWIANPQTLAMRQLAFDLKLPHVQSRLEELQQRQDAFERIQREGRATAQAVQDLFRLTGTKRQPDGSLILDGNNWRLKQLGDTVSVTVKADDREILRVEGGKVVVFQPTPEERQKMQNFREQVHSALLKVQQQQLSAERKPDQGLSL